MDVIPEKKPFNPIDNLKGKGFKKGQSGNPKGRLPPKGRMLLLEEIEKWLATDRVAFVKKLKQQAMSKPIAFMRDVYIPLLPKDFLLKMTGEDGKTVMWQCLTEMGVSPEHAEMMTQVANQPKVIDVDSEEVPDANP